MRIEVHQDKCTGCRLCQQICAIAHFEQINPKMSAIAIKAEFPVPGVYVPMLCNQCGECVEACPMEAIALRDGAYVIDKELCTDCGACVAACPTSVIFEHRGAGAPIICDLCLECTTVCNTGALVAVP